jgi:hypothetical protein
MFETWEQKLVAIVAAVTVGGGVTIMVIKVPYLTSFLATNEF